jgi:hypothetical protein
MRGRVSVSVKDFNGENWGDLAVIAPTHDIVGEKVSKIEENFSFIGGHRVRLYRFKKNVHWKIPVGVLVDISAVAPAGAVRRQQGGR